MHYCAKTSIQDIIIDIVIAKYEQPKRGSAKAIFAKWRLSYDLGSRLAFCFNPELVTHWACFLAQ